jgi:hypothetical protein
MRAAREQKTLQETWQGSFQGNQGRLGADTSLENNYAEWLDKESGKRREDHRLYDRTILEEEDSEEDF